MATRFALAALAFGLGPVSAQDAPAPKSFGDWEYSCAPEGAPCTLSQANVEKDTNNVRMRTEISTLEDGRILLSVTLPETVLLTEGPWLTVDGLFIGPLTYVTCAGGCLARTAYTEAQFSLIAKGQRGIVTVITNTGQRIGVALSLSGLPEAIEALTSQP